MGKWTIGDIPSLKGRVAIVTGANSGLGLSTTERLSEKGCEVIMACRSTGKADDARKELLKRNPEASLRVMQLDLADLTSVRAFTESFLNEYTQLDLLINNAGLMAIPYRRTVDGFEMQFGVNHLGHFALTGHLFNLLRNTPGSRVVNVSSSAQSIGSIRFNDIHWEKNYRKWLAYGMSKLANILFTHEMAERASSIGLEIKVLAAHPGYADSRLIEKGAEMNGRDLLVKAGRLANRLVAQSTEMGALPILYAATSPDAVSRGYYVPGGFAGMRGYPVRSYPRNRNVSKDAQSRLWELSEKLTGVSFLSSQ